MKKIKKRKKYKLTETWIPIKDAEKCPVCNFPFQASMQFINKRVFVCLICEKGFEKIDNIMVDIAKSLSE